MFVTVLALIIALVGLAGVATRSRTEGFTLFPPRDIDMPHDNSYTGHV